MEVVSRKIQCGRILDLREEHALMCERTLNVCERIGEERNGRTPTREGGLG